MRRLFLLFTLLVAASPALAQDDALAFTPEDEGLMIACRDGIETRWAEGKTEAKLEECIGAASGACMELPDGGTTVGMSECLARETAWWDAELNMHYERLASTLDAEVLPSLRATQRAWIAFRDADCGFQYEYWAEGTVRSLFYGSCMLDRTARRALELEDYADWG